MRCSRGTNCRSSKLTGRCKSVRGHPRCPIDLRPWLQVCGSRWQESPRALAATYCRAVACGISAGLEEDLGAVAQSDRIQLLLVTDAGISSCHDPVLYLLSKHLPSGQVKSKSGVWHDGKTSTAVSLNARIPGASPSSWKVSGSGLTVSKSFVRCTARALHGLQDLGWLLSCYPCEAFRGLGPARVAARMHSDRRIRLRGPVSRYAGEGPTCSWLAKKLSRTLRKSRHWQPTWKRSVEASECPGRFRQSVRGLPGTAAVCH